MEFKEVDGSVLFLRGKAQSNKVAAFDLDGTLVRPDTGLTFSESDNDWVFTTNVDKLVSVFTRYIKEEWTIVIFSNQKNIKEITKKRIRVIIWTMESLIRDFAPFVYLATKEDKYRKPKRGMYDLFLRDAKIKEVAKESFYCGDASGSSDPNVLYQWSNSDHIFALNMDLTFHTPDEILGEYQLKEIPEKGIILLGPSPRVFTDFISSLPKSYQVVTLEKALQTDKIPVVILEDPSQKSRDSALAKMPTGSKILLSTYPVRAYGLSDSQARKHANNLDYHIVDHEPFDSQKRDPNIIRLN